MEMLIEPPTAHDGFQQYLYGSACRVFGVNILAEQNIAVIFDLYTLSSKSQPMSWVGAAYEANGTSPES